MIETEEEKRERWARYNLNIGDVVYVKSVVKSIGPNCMVEVEPFDHYNELSYKTHRNMITSPDV